MNNPLEHLKLDNQLCFLLYASSREMTKHYQPLLKELNITYPQYLVLLLLWEHSELTVKQLGDYLYLDSGTLTPMLKRMEQNELLIRERSQQDERSVMIRLTDKAILLQEKAATIPNSILDITGYNEEEYHLLKTSLYQLLQSLHAK